MWAGPVTDPSPANHPTGFINTLTQGGLGQCLPVGTVTRPADSAGSFGTTIDLVWATGDIQRRLCECKTRSDLEAESDHVPIETTIRMETPQTPQERRRKYKDMVIAKFRKHMQENPLGETVLNSIA
ncbi:uncharacterized protein M437DRAFT_70469 [Aureobasidium melanogenum CBS 110374]|uniref:Endonuclease/exonuclease/phosphatase domain-containing protein n=1 Tax=Aureobasidium melanogenum (strain CBS 110374) TaxID=1043003 RepID=A0A074W5K2_AURM1|nr:uncharacterized protein M437DRAFT_70469 [Aureobasidium melanogenum CBS 110374]KEQ57861.1 hypothetical protein M437DRAFT_70469 [Aureobasidium melanogenum CBS 110374]